MAGYSGTPLIQKLGIKPNSTVVAINPPSAYRKLLGPGANSVEFQDTVTTSAGFVHLFVTTRSDLKKNLRQLRRKIADSGVLWISWPKKSSGVQTDVTEDIVRAIALPLDFVDVKVCAVDEIWSGLKLVIRREHRKQEGKT